MNASKHGINAPSGLCAEDKNLFQVRMSHTVRAAHSPQYIGGCHLAIEYQWRCCCLAVRKMNASKHGPGISALSWWSGADKNLFQVRTSYTVRAEHIFVSLVTLLWQLLYSRCYWASMRMLLLGCPYNERLQAWYQCTFSVVWSW